MLALASAADCLLTMSICLQPERIEGRSYSISSDVWSTGISLLEFAQNRFPYPPDLGPIDLLQVIVRGPVSQKLCSIYLYGYIDRKYSDCIIIFILLSNQVPSLDDDKEEGGDGHWSQSMKDFIRVWYVFMFSFCVVVLTQFPLVKPHR
jgi:serine/threonine protein kinase